MTKQLNAEYARKAAYAAHLADAAWLASGLDGMRYELENLRRNDADPVIVAEVQRLYTNQMLRVLPA